MIPKCNCDLCRYYDAEDGDGPFDGPEPLTKEELTEEASFWYNRVQSNGFSASDFDYDPLSRRGFE